MSYRITHRARQDVVEIWNYIAGDSEEAADRCVDLIVRDVMNPDTDGVTDPAVVCYPGEPLRQVVYRMADTGRTRLPVVSDIVRDGDAGELLGTVSLADLLKARLRDLDEERRGERVLRFQFPGWRKPIPEHTGANSDAPS